MNRLESAINFAFKAHEGQLDKIGLPVILHPLEVMLKLKLESEAIVGVLHDVLEDTLYTIEDIQREVDLQQEEVSALIALTHLPYEPYIDYIRRVKQNPLAVQVKLADLSHNTSFDRLNQLPIETQNRLLKKYKMAYEILLGKS